MKNKLNNIKIKVEAANNLEELLSVFNLIGSSNLKFGNEKLAKYYMPMFAMVFLILSLIYLVLILDTSFDNEGCFFLFFSVIVLIAIVYGGHFFELASNTAQISDTIALKKVALDNNLKFVETNKKQLMQQFEDSFCIFQLGNYSRELTRYIMGEHSNFVYHYFYFHYVDKCSSTSTDANGNKTSTTTYHHYNVYGIIIPFNVKHYIKISNYKTYAKPEKSIEWRTSSITFNKKFKVYTDNELAVAVFLQPTVIDKIEKLYETFPELDIEISPKGLLSLSTPDKELLNHTRQHGVDQLDLFKQELTKVLDQTKLHKALEFIDFLQEYQR